MANYGKAIRISYTTSMFAVVALQTGLSVFDNIRPSVPFVWRIVPAVASATFLAIIESLSTYYFQGPIIEKYTQKHSCEPLPNPTSFPEFSPAQKAKFYLTKYGYGLSATISNFVDDYFQASALYSWIMTLITANGLAELAVLPLPWLWGVIGFHVLFVFVFRLMTDTWETVSQLEESYPTFEDKFSKNILHNRLFENLSGARGFRWYMRLFGSLAHMIQHIVPFIVLVPVSWLLNLYQTNLAGFLSFAVPYLALAILPIGLITFIQTFYFEGAFSSRNLQAFSQGRTDPDEKRPMSQKLKDIFDKLLYGGIFINAVDMAASIILAILRIADYNEVNSKVANGIAYGIGIFVGLFLVAPGMLFSEVKEAQHDLEENVIGEGEGFACCQPKPSISAPANNKAWCCLWSPCREKKREQYEALYDDPETEQLGMA